MPDMKTLIRAMYARGLSNRELEARAAEAGHTVKFQTFSELANNAPKSFPKRVETIRGMAAALGVTERAVVLAYAESLGVDVSRVGFADLIPRSADVLEPDMREAVLSVIRAATKDLSLPMTDEEAREWERSETERINEEHARNKRMTTHRPRRGSGSTVSDDDGTTTPSKDAKRRGA